MKFCRKCGAEASGNVSLCPECGAFLSSSPSEPKKTPDSEIVTDIKSIPAVTVTSKAPSVNAEKVQSAPSVNAEKAQSVEANIPPSIATGIPKSSAPNPVQRGGGQLGARRFCGRCGTEAPAGAEICLNCGCMLGNTVQEPQYRTEARGYAEAQNFGYGVANAGQNGGVSPLGNVNAQRQASFGQIRPEQQGFGARRFCGRCGREVTRGVTVCQGCGCMLENTVQEPQYWGGIQGYTGTTNASRFENPTARYTASAPRASGDPDGKILLTVFNFATAVAALVATFLLGLSVFALRLSIGGYYSISLKATWGDVAVGAAVASGAAFGLAVTTLIISIVKRKNIDTLLSIIFKMLWCIAIFILAIVALY